MNVSELRSGIESAKDVWRSRFNVFAPDTLKSGHQAQPFLKSAMRCIASALVAFGFAIGLMADEPKEIPLWANGAPGSEGKTSKEIVETSAIGERRVSGIHNPSVTPFLPARAKATGAAVIVVPGGGHRILCVDHEGYNVAEWLKERGIAAFVLKNRLARETNSTYKIDVESLADMKRAVRLVRHRAEEWGVRKERIGVMGFSAGGELAALVSMRFDAGAPGASDPIERESCRPDFQALIYPGRSGDIQPATNSPPVFLACGYNDRPDISRGLADVYLRFKQAGVPADLHIYSAAGHGFGVRANMKGAVGTWLARFEDWLSDSGFLKQP